MPNWFKPQKIISGGQTGVDRAALDVAISQGISHGGWCPRGRRAEDGVIDSRYQLQETEEGEYAVRTERNIQEADATLILCQSEPQGGTRLTVQFARRHDKPCLIVRLDEKGLVDSVDTARDWLDSLRPATLNVAGPRESQAPGIYAEAREFLEKVLRERGRRNDE